MSAAVFFAAALLYGWPAMADNGSGASDTGPVNLRRPGSGEQTLTSSTTGPLVLSGAPREPRKLSIGINDLGGQLRFHLFGNWAAEARYLMGSSSSDVGTVKAMVVGLRGYRFFPEHHRFRLYCGLEGDHVQTSLGSVNNGGNPSSVANVSGFGETTGYAAGAFGGVEYRLGRRIAFDLDAGPYMIGLQEKVTNVSGSTLDFVVDTAINVYLF